MKNHRIRILTGKNNPILRRKAEEISVADLILDKEIIRNLKITLKKIKIGVGLAAPQIGQSKRIFIIKTKALEEGSSQGNIPLNKQFMVFSNPKVLAIGVEEENMEEGCLSLPGILGIVSRPRFIKIEAIDEKGDRFIIDGNGYLARIIQHELDHLNGILFIDKAEKVYKELKPDAGQNYPTSGFGAKI